MRGLIYRKNNGKKKSQNPTEPDIFHQPITRKNAKEAFIAFCGEMGLQALFYAFFTTAIGLVIWISAWFLVLLIPIGVAVYYLLTKKDLS